MGLGVCLLLVMGVPMARRVPMDLGAVALRRSGSKIDRRAAI